MKKAFIVATLGALLLAPAHAGTSTFDHSEDKGDKRICYYGFDGLDFHYVIANETVVSDYFATCAVSIEVPFASSSGWAVLFKEQIQQHNPVFKDCYYGLDGQLVIQQALKSRSCHWAIVPSIIQPTQVGKLPQAGEERLRGTQTKVCYYGPVETGARTHYRMLSVHSDCPDNVNVP